ncbi:MAG: IS3 family transposase [Phycisphaeraceae bacterium]
MAKRKRATYTQEQKDEAVNLALKDGNVSKVARDLGLNQSTLRLWIQKARAQAPEGGLLDVEKEEVLRLREEVKRLREERDFLKKTSKLFREGLTKMEVIERLRRDFSISFMCRKLRVTRQGFYAWKKRPESNRSIEDRRLVSELREISRESRGTYGSPRAHRELREAGVKVSRKRVARLMAANNITGRVKRRSFKPRLQAKETMPAPNLLDRKFNPKKRNQVWASDITYLQTNQGWLFLCVVIDLYSRRVVGWAMDNKQDSEMVSRALNMALVSRGMPSKLMHHSDQGCQYTSEHFRKVLKENGVQCSMSRRGNCWDNACVESFFGTIKQEMYFETTWKTRAELKEAVFEYIEVFYNRKRRHSTLGFVSPADFEQTAI